MADQSFKAEVRCNYKHILYIVFEIITNTFLDDDLSRFMYYKGRILKNVEKEIGTSYNTKVYR